MRSPWSNTLNRESAVLVYLSFWVDLLKTKTSCKNIALLLNDAMFCMMLLKKLAPHVFDDVL